MSEQHGTVRALVERAMQCGEYIGMGAEVIGREDAIRAAADALDARQWEQVDNAAIQAWVGNAGMTHFDLYYDDGAYVRYAWDGREGYEYAIMRRPKGEGSE